MKMTILVVRLSFCLLAVLSFFCEAFVVVTTTNPTLTRRREQELPSSYNGVRPDTRLHSKKKTGSTTAPSSSSGTKIQVKLLQHIAGTGQAGDVIQVTPAFYNNKLRPERLAKPITDEEVEKQTEESQQKRQQTLEVVETIQSLLDNHSVRLSDNKTGPDGHKLFGGIGPKKLIQALIDEIPPSEDIREYLSKNKQVKVLEIVQEGSGEEVKGDIKETGSYKMKLQLYKQEDSGGKRKGNNNSRSGSSNKAMAITVDVTVVVE
jgi:ribosomal protein L9